MYSQAIHDDSMWNKWMYQNWGCKQQQVGLVMLCNFNCFQNYIWWVFYANDFTNFVITNISHLWRGEALRGHTFGGDSCLPCYATPKFGERSGKSPCILSMQLFKLTHSNLCRDSEIWNLFLHLLSAFPSWMYCKCKYCIASIENHRQNFN